MGRDTDPVSSLVKICTLWPGPIRKILRYEVPGHPRKVSKYSRMCQCPIENDSRFDLEVRMVPAYQPPEKIIHSE